MIAAGPPLFLSVAVEQRASDRHEATFDVSTEAIEHITLQHVDVCFEWKIREPPLCCHGTTCTLGTHLIR